MFGHARTPKMVTVLALAAALIGAAACGSSGGGSSGGPTNDANNASGIPDGPIKIGMVAELSGGGAAIGNYQVAVQKALAGYINDNGGIAGHKVQLVIENNQSDAASAVIAARKLVKENVAASVYSGLGSSGKDQVLAVFAKAKLVGIDPTPVAKYDNASDYPYFFTDNPIDPNAMVAEAAFAKKHGYDKIGQLGNSTPFSDSLEKNFGAEAKKQGLTVVKTIDYPTTTTTMTTQLSQLRDAGAETLGLWCENECGKVFDGLRQIGWSPNILTTQVLYYTGFDALKEFAGKTFGDCPIYLASGEKPSDTLSAIIKAVAPKSGGSSVRNQGIVLNADSWLVLKYAIEKAKSLDGDKIKAAIETIAERSFSDPDVTYTFSPEHHAGFQASHPEKIGMCGFKSLGVLDLPVLAS